MKTTEQQHNERKREIMEKCFECYAENGLTGTGIKALADACGCTKANLYSYFKNLDELIIESTAYCMEKETRAACKYLKEAYAKYGNWLCVAAAYNAGQGRISTQLQKQMVSQAADLWLVEETSRYMFRLLAAKAVISNPQRYGFLLKREHLYPAIPYTEVTVTTGIDNLAQFAKNKGITYAQLKDANPWLRDTSLMNKSGRTYILKIPTQAGMHYDPKKTVPYNKNWVIN